MELPGQVGRAESKGEGMFNTNDVDDYDALIAAKSRERTRKTGRMRSAAGPAQTQKARNRVSTRAKDAIAESGNNNNVGKSSEITADANTSGPGKATTATAPMAGSKEKTSLSKRRRSYDSTLFGLDVFEGLQVDYEKNQAEDSAWRILKFFPIQHPNSRIRRVWDLVSVFVILFSVYTAMFDFAFAPEVPLIENEVVGILDQLSEIFFWADVVFNFFTADYDAEGDIIYDRRRIAANYCGTWLLVDVVSNLPLGGGWALIKGLRLFRFPRMILRWANLGVSVIILNLFKLFVSITTSGHLVACAFFMVARIENHQESSWTYLH